MGGAGMRVSDLEGRSTRVAPHGSVEVQGADGQWRVLGTLGLDGVIREPEGFSIDPEAFQGEAPRG